MQFTGEKTMSSLVSLQVRRQTCVNHPLKSLEIAGITQSNSLAWCSVVNYLLTKYILKQAIGCSLVCIWNEWAQFSP